MTFVESVCRILICAHSKLIQSTGTKKLQLKEQENRLIVATRNNTIATQNIKIYRVGQKKMHP